MNDPWVFTRGDQPVVATAIHAGHDVRPDVAALLAISDADRLREEDPFTDAWVRVAENQVVVDRSRFEFDLNRPRDAAVYIEPADAWGLEVWAEPPPDAVVELSRQFYDEFYAELRALCDQLVARHGRFVLVDLHSYNHRRGGPDAPVDDPDENPEINIGTGTVDMGRWGPLVERFRSDLAEAPFDGGHLDVRENVKFRGGHLSRWVHETYPETGCALAIEVKKFYMDEWSGEPEETVIGAIGEALEATVPGLLEHLAGQPAG